MKRKLVIIVISFFVLCLLGIELSYAATVTSIEPQQPKIGDMVTVRGSGFGASKSLGKICVGSSCYISETTWSPNEIVFYIPTYVSPGTLTIEPYCSYNSSCEAGAWIGPTVTAQGGSYSISTKPPIYPGGEVVISTTGYSTYFADFGSTQGTVTIGSQTASVKSWTSSKITIQIPSSISPGAYQLLVTAPSVVFESIKIEIQKLPTFIGITPDRDIVRGVTRVHLQGSGFGITFCSHCDIFVGPISIESAAWTDADISFIIPEDAPPVGQIRLVLNGVKIANPYYSTTANYSEKTPNTNDPLSDKQFYLSNIGAISGWSQQNSGAIIVAVLDDGIYLNHPDLNPAIWSNKKEIVGNKKDDDGNGFIDDVFGYNFLNNTAEMSPTGSHGTEVAGIIGAVKNNKIGISGIASGVQLMPVIVCSSDGCPLKAIIEGIKYAVDNGARVINLSLGSKGFNVYSSEYDEAIKYAYSRNVVVVASAGNGDEIGKGLGVNTTQFPVSPACNDGGLNMVLGVSGTDEVGVIPGWVNYGKCVDVYAPATDIVTTTVPKSANEYYAYRDGTSFSAPMVSAIAAMVLSRNPHLSTEQVVGIIIDTSEQKTISGKVGPHIPQMDKALKGASETTGNAVAVQMPIKSSVQTPTIPTQPPVTSTPKDDSLEQAPSVGNIDKTFTVPESDIENIREKIETASVVSFRKCPSSQCSALRTYEVGAVLDVIGKYKKGDWYQVLGTTGPNDGGEKIIGWVNMEDQENATVGIDNATEDQKSEQEPTESHESFFVRMWKSLLRWFR